VGGGVAKSNAHSLVRICGAGSSVVACCGAGVGDVAGGGFAVQAEKSQAASHKHPTRIGFSMQQCFFTKPDLAVS
jgi:hypothetical protein